MAERESGANQLVRGELVGGLIEDYTPSPQRGQRAVVNGVNGGQRVVNGWSDRQTPLSGTALSGGTYFGPVFLFCLGCLVLVVPGRFHLVRG